MEPKASIPVANGLGECILWDDRNGQALWTDMPGRRLYSHDPSTGTTASVSLQEDLCSFGLIADGDELICGFQSGIAIMDRQGRRGEWLHRLPNPKEVRLNDGRVDRQGRFWVGSMVDNDGNQLKEGVFGELFSLDSAGTVRSHLDGIRIANSLCWSPDGGTLYFGDSPRREIHAFDFDQANGTLGNRRVFARTPAGGVPDGSTVDAEGCLWNAEWGSGRVVRYAPNGQVAATIQLPVSQPTCVALGGEQLTDLYVTTAKIGLSADALCAEPRAGDVFVFEAPAPGLPEARFIDRIRRSG